MSKRSAPGSGKEAIDGTVNIKLPSANPVWLHAGADEKYLLLEDPETKDILMPLIYMKPLLSANYSRKLAALKHRQVTVGSEGPLADKAGLLYWQWAFEAAACIKSLVRKELGEENTPQGHLRLVLVPIVYNALAVREEMHTLPLFRALHSALRRSSYWPLLIPPDGSVPEELNAELAADREVGQRSDGEQEQAPLFTGPTTLEGTAKKYMFCFKDASEVEQSKKARTTGAAVQQKGVVIKDPAPKHRKDADRHSALAGPGALLGAGSTAEAASEHLLRASGAAVDSRQGRLNGTAPQHDRQLRPAAAPEQALPTLPSVPDGLAYGSGSGCGAAARPNEVDSLQQLMQPLAAQQAQQALLPGGGGLVLLLVQQFRQMLQQELLPLQQQVEVLAEELASLKRTVLQRTSMPITGGAAGAAHAPLPPAWPVLPAQKSDELPPAALDRNHQGQTLEDRGGWDLRAILQQQVGSTWPSQDDEPEGGQLQHHAAARGAGMPTGFHLAGSPLASLNFLVDQFTSRALQEVLPPALLPPPASASIAPTRPSFGGGRPPAPIHRNTDRQKQQQYAATVQHAAMKNALAAAADALVQAAAGAAGPGHAQGSGGSSGEPCHGQPPAGLDDLVQGEQSGALPEGDLNWGQLLSSLGTGGLDAALQALAQQHTEPRPHQPTGGSGVPQQRQCSSN